MMLEIALVVDPMQMKSIHKWLENNIKEYERLFGTIPPREEVESSTRRRPGQ